MKLCGIAQSVSNQSLQWHVVAMYAPGFVTGRLISRFGAPRIVFAGLILTGASALVGLGGTAPMYFVGSLILLGLGWNFGFVGASALILETHLPEERTRVQSLNDFIIFGAMVIGSFASGGVLSRYGWNVVCLISFPPLLLAAGALAAMTARKPQAVGGI
jgi:MFS family permease